MYWTVDRVEEQLVVLMADSGELFSIPLGAIGTVREGDVLSVQMADEERTRRAAEAEAELSMLIRPRDNA
ncbi:MAG: DUF3006 domain-containing protein [Clostridia bacterium]|jgi:hypothetical protein|nr:DUF3006 domain-containing protein [Clostridia bacterium]